MGRYQRNDLKYWNDIYNDEWEFWKYVIELGGSNWCGHAESFTFSKKDRCITLDFLEDGFTI